MQALIEFYFAVGFVPMLLAYTLVGTMWLEKRKFFVPALIIGVIAISVGGYFLWTWAKTQEKYVICLVDILLFIVLSAFVFGLYRCTVFEAVFYTVFGWTVQHLGSSVGRVIAQAANIDIMGIFFAPHSAAYFAISFTMDVVCITAVALFMRFCVKGALVDLEKKKLLIPAVLLNVTFSAVSVYTDVMSSEFYIVKTLDIMCCIANLTLLYNVFETDRYRNEIEVMTRLEKQRREQYEISRETIDVINTKCHDLKKLVRSALADADMKSDMKAIERSLNIYDGIVATGNDTLDLVLTEKSLYCDSKNIKLAVTADGAALDGLSKLDIYSLFGNIMDNAIEAVAALPEEKRHISLSVRKNGKLVKVHSDNYFDGQSRERTDGGLIKTSKQNAVEHGYGLLSIRRVAEKYGGVTDTNIDDDIFNINIVMNVG